MPMCLDCNEQVSMAHAIKNPTHHVVAISRNPKVQSHIKGIIDLHRRRSIPPEELEGADDLTNIRKEHTTDDSDSPSLWWLAVPAAIAIVTIILVHRSNRSEEPVPDNSEDAYYG